MVGAKIFEVIHRIQIIRKFVLVTPTDINIKIELYIYQMRIKYTIYKCIV